MGQLTHTSEAASVLETPIQLLGFRHSNRLILLGATLHPKSATVAGALRANRSLQSGRRVESSFTFAPEAKMFAVRQHV